MDQDNAINRQLALPLEPRAEAESALHYAWASSRLRVPFEVAIHVPALAICLRNLAAAEIRRKIRRYARARLQAESQAWVRDETDSPEIPLFNQ